MKLLGFAVMFFTLFVIAITGVWRGLTWLAIYVRPERIAQGFAIGIIVLFCLMFSYIFAKAVTR